MAIEKAIEIISSGAVAGNADKHLPSLMQNKASLLAQLRSDLNAQAKLQVVSYLTRRARQLNSRVLSAIAQRASDDPFQKVKTSCSGLVFGHNLFSACCRPSLCRPLHPHTPSHWLLACQSALERLLAVGYELLSSVLGMKKLEGFVLIFLKMCVFSFILLYVIRACLSCVLSVFALYEMVEKALLFLQIRDAWYIYTADVVPHFQSAANGGNFRIRAIAK